MLELQHIQKSFHGKPIRWWVGMWLLILQIVISGQSLSEKKHQGLWMVYLSNMCMIVY